MLARNTLINIATQITVAVLAFLAIPTVIRSIGDETFGLLSTVWMVVGYFSIFDLGLSQASVKFLARHFEVDEKENANATIVISLIGSSLMGLVAGAAIVIGAPFLSEHVLRLSPAQIPVACSSLRLVGIAVPFVLVQASLRAVPMAAQRFDLVNVIQLASGFLQWGGSLILVLLHFGLYEIILVTVVTRILACVASFLIVRYLVPTFRWNGLAQLRLVAPRMLRFGGWMSLTQIISPVVGYLDRIFITTFLSMKSMAYYSVPFEALSRLQVIPLGLSMALFPAIASRDTDDRNSQESIGRLYGKSLKGIMVIFLPLSAVLAVFSHEILSVWLGDTDFAAHSSTVFSLLAIAVSIQALAYVPVTALQASGKPDVAAKLYAAEIPVYLALCYFLIPNFGINGAAVAWLIRLILIASAFHIVSTLLLRTGTVRKSVSKIWKIVAINIGFLVLIVAFWALPLWWPYQAACVGAALLVYGAAIWRFCLDPDEREISRRIFSVRKRACLNG